MAYNSGFHDTFTESDVFQCLDSIGANWKNGSRYILSTCPMPDHDDAQPSAQIYRDDWFVNCLAGCGRFHITKAFPQLLPVDQRQRTPEPVQTKKAEKPVNHKKYELYDVWSKLPPIPRDHKFKNIPLEVLDEMGWRWTDGSLGMGIGYFIPYFSISKKRIPFAQVRHLTGNRRFTFLKDAQPTMYGMWNIHPNDPLFIVEGPSDCAVLEYCAVPYVGAPSAGSGALVGKLADYALEHGLQLIYAGDNDEAGDKLREALEGKAPYRLCQPPKKYKDWGDFLEAEGQEVVSQYAYRMLQPPTPLVVPDDWAEEAAEFVDKNPTLQLDI